MVKIICIEKKMNNTELSSKEGLFFYEKDFDLIIDYDCDVYKL